MPLELWLGPGSKTKWDTNTVGWFYRKETNPHSNVKYGESVMLWSIMDSRKHQIILNENLGYKCVMFRPSSKMTIQNIHSNSHKMVQQPQDQVSDMANVINLYPYFPGMPIVMKLTVSPSQVLRFSTSRYIGLLLWLCGCFWECFPSGLSSSL